jgi:acylphosphatase
MTTVKGWVSGKVQGVWFRKYLQTECLKLGLRGYARNLPDGRVEVLLWGAEEAVAKGKLAVARGSPGSRVSDVLWQELHSEVDCQGFEVL